MTKERLEEIQYLVRRLSWLINDKQDEEPIHLVWDKEDLLIQKMRILTENIRCHHVTYDEVLHSCDTPSDRCVKCGEIV
jgi:hypothetical protein